MFSGNKHNQVDDYPYGGGAGMVLKPEPMFSAVEAITAGKKPTYYFDVSAGRTLYTKKSRRASSRRRISFFYVDIMKAMMNVYVNILSRMKFQLAILC